jgi:RNA polymerase sigma-70 factor (ECF subfamily)
VADDVRRQIVDLLPRLRRFAYTLTGDMERADDLVQETCVRALSRLEQWEEGTRLDSWLYRIAQNIWFDRLRALKVRGEVVDIDSAPELAGDDGRTVTESRLTLGDVSSAIEKLPADQRVVLALVCVEGLSYREAAETLKVPIGTVMSRLARARQFIFRATHGDEPVAKTQVEVARGRVVR